MITVTTGLRDRLALDAAASAGALWRLTLVFSDLVGSTEMSARLNPADYRWVLQLYKAICQSQAEDRHGGHVVRVTGDGVLAVFAPTGTRDEDVRQAVRAGLGIVREVRRLSQWSEVALGEELAARVAVHRGYVSLDADDEIYGRPANLAARLQELAPRSSVVVSEELLGSLGDRFDTEAQEPQKVKGVDEPLASWRVLADRHRPPGAAALGRLAGASLDVEHRRCI